MVGWLSWKEETTGGTSIIDAVDTQTYKFGKRNDSNVEHESIKRTNTILSRYLYSSRNPILEYGTYNIPNLLVKCNPCTPIPYYHFLGDSTDGTPATIQLDETNPKPSLTIQHQWNSGVNHGRQLIGAQAAAIAGKIELGKEEELEIIYAGKQIDDLGGSVPYLTTAPILPENINKAYYGKPKVTWDVGGENLNLYEIKRVDYSQSQVVSINHAGSIKDVNFHQMEPVELTFLAVLQTENQWDDLVDENTVDVTVRSFKSDQEKYKDLLFDDVKIGDIKTIGKIYNDMYLSQIIAKAEKFTVSFVDETTTFSDWYGS